VRVCQRRARNDLAQPEVDMGDEDMLSDLTVVAISNAEDPQMFRLEPDALTDISTAQSSSHADYPSTHMGVNSPGDFRSGRRDLPD
jgi:hypothetical protein